MSISRLIEFWAEKSITDPEGFKIHPKDKKVLSSWLENGNRTAIAADEGRPGALHLSLSPVPYVGNLRTADIFLAMTNPTVGEPDYVDNKKPAFRRMLQANLDQNNVVSCFALDATWPSWSNYYRRFFGRFVSDYARISEISEQEVWSELGSRLAILELVPYYSKTATDLTQTKLYKTLPSALFAQSALQEIAANRPEGKALIICRWKKGPERWGITDEARCVVAGCRGGLCKQSKEKLRWFLDLSRNGSH
jgi:hypothetical protein